MGGFEYSNSSLQHFAMSEGRVLAGPGTYQYFLKDHLGNIRMTITPGAANSDKIVQQDFYYPFGMRQAIKMPGLGNKKLYNGKELVDQNGLNWYHYGARWYDPMIGRWTTMDPRCQFHSPYEYGGNNPAAILDPDGAQCIDALTISHLACTLSDPQIMSPLLSGFSDYTEQGGKVFDIAGTGVLAAGLINDALLELPGGVTLTATGTGMIYTGMGLEGLSLAARGINKGVYGNDDPKISGELANYAFRLASSNVIPSVGSSRVLQNARELTNQMGDFTLSKIDFSPMVNAISSYFSANYNSGNLTPDVVTGPLVFNPDPNNPEQSLSH